MEELWDRIQEIWTDIPINYLQELYESMPRRMKEVYRNHGGLTKYSSIGYSERGNSPSI
jgi:hypothetical protein